MTTLHFVQRFNASYRRVQKARDEKNLRCFPGHLPTGHCVSSFCGGPVVMYTASTGSAAAEPQSALHDFYGELCLAQAAARSSMPWDAPNVLRAARQGDALIFNGDAQPWRYDWTSNAATCHSLHVFRVYQVDATTSRVVACTDSPAFTVSSFRNKNVDEELGAVSPSDPLHVVIGAIRDRVRSFDIDALHVLPGIELDEAEFMDCASIGGSSLTMDLASTDMLLEIEGLDALLTSCAQFIAEGFKSWRHASQLKTGLEAHLASEHAEGLAGLAERIEALFGYRVSSDALSLVVSSSSVHSQVILVLAKRLALGSLASGTRLEDHVSSQHDLSGRYVRPRAFVAALDDFRARSGEWNSVDRSLVEKNGDLLVLMAVNACTVMVCQAAADLCGWGKMLLLRLNAVNRPGNLRPLDFRGASDHAVCTWAYSGGLQIPGVVSVVMGDGPMVCVQTFERGHEGALNVRLVLWQQVESGWAADGPPRDFVFERAV